jgi:Iron-sulfur cluster-binding domain/4Fe-4S single cluster domain
MPFCYSPWTNIDIGPVGTVAPCCKFQKQYYGRTYNIQRDSINDYVTSPMLELIKKEFNQNQWPIGCERCRIEEENGITSKRQLDWDRWQDEYKKLTLTQTEFITASIAFGNTCNLKCITCNSSNSSRWQQEYREIYNVDWPHVQFYKNNFVQHFTNLAPGLVHLDIPGGEPFLSGIHEQLQLLQYYVDSGRARDVTLHYTTNANLFPDDRWWQLWQHFKEIDLQISVDGVDARYEYIRYPGKWLALTNNVEQYLTYEKQHSNVRLSVSHTVSAYNIYYLDEFFAWCESVGLPRPWLGRVHRPDHMRPSVWPANARAAIYNKLIASQYLDVQSWAELITSTDDTEYFDQFCKFTSQHDQYRQVDFSKTFPEMAQYLK